MAFFEYIFHPLENTRTFPEFSSVRSSFRKISRSVSVSRRRAFVPRRRRRRRRIFVARRGEALCKYVFTPFVHAALRNDDDNS